MMLTYSRLYPDFWNSSVSALDDSAQALAAYLMSNQGANPFGLYYKPLELMARERQRTQEQLRASLAELSRIDYCRFDEPTGWVWVMKMAEWQFKPLPLKANNLAIRGARRWYSNMPRNPFLGLWWDRYNDAFHLADEVAFPGSEVARREWAGRAPLTLPEHPKAEALPGLELSPPAAPMTAIERRKPAQACGEVEFEIWWTHYPRKEAKKAALNKWLAKKIPIDNLPMLIEKLQAQKRGEKWLQGIIEHASTYLHQERWNDEIRTGPRLSRQNTRTALTLAEIASEINPFDEDDRR
jgi:hypothetical protein